MIIGKSVWQVCWKVSQSFFFSFRLRSVRTSFCYSITIYICWPCLIPCLIFFCSVFQMCLIRLPTDPWSWVRIPELSTCPGLHRGKYITIRWLPTKFSLSKFLHTIFINNKLTLKLRGVHVHSYMYMSIKLLIWYPIFLD